MSTIQTQVALIHVTSQLSATSAVLRESVESDFSSDSVSVTTAEEAVDYGGMVDPRQVFIKLISGDPVRVGLSTGVYPLRLTDPDEAQMLRLDVEGRYEVSRVTAIADSSGSLDGLYFDIEDADGPVRVWLDVDNASTPPATPALGRLIEVDIVTDDTNESVAAAIAAALDADAEFSASRNVAAVDITDARTGARTDITAGTSTMTVSTVNHGSAPPTVYLKSTGASQVVVAVAPN